MTSNTASAPVNTAPIDTDVVVIGAGAVGLFQAFQLGLQGLRVHLVDALPQAGGQCSQLYPHKPIYDLPGIPACTGAELITQLQTQIAPFGVVQHGGQQVQTLESQAAGRWQLRTHTGTVLTASAVVIAAGVGAFVPRAVKVDGIDALVGHSVHYHPANLASLPLAGQSVLVHGGDDLAVDAALALLQLPADLRPTQVTLLHRRDVFTALPDQLAQLQAARNQGALQVVIGQPTALHAAGNQLAQVHVDLPDGGTQRLDAQQWLIYQGISPKLGPVAEWGLALEKKQLPVNTATFATATPGIYAVGDINTYPGKRKLLVCGFHEATLAAFAIAEQLQGQPVLLQYTTTSSLLHERLGRLPASVHHPD